MELEKVLGNAKEREISREEALYLFQQTRTYDKTLRLFQVASEVRDEEVGRIIKISIGGLGPIGIPCTTDPPCKYCIRSSKTLKSELYNTELTLEEIKLGAKLIEETGTKSVRLAGGIMPYSAGKRIVDVVKTIKSASNLEVYNLNFGPSFSEEALIELKKLGVKEVASSFETMNEKLFREVKPGDSLEAKKKFAETINDIGLGLWTVLMVGLGGSYSYEDHVNQMFYVKEFENFNCLGVQRFAPIPGTPLENLPPASPLETARTAAIARLIFRDKDVQIGGSDIYFPFSILAGVNRTYAGASIYKGVRERELLGHRSLGHWSGGKTKKVDDFVLFNPLSMITKYVEEAGMEVE